MDAGIQAFCYDRTCVDNPVSPNGGGGGFIDNVMANPWVGAAVGTAQAIGTTAGNVATFIGGGIAGDSEMAAAGWDSLVNKDKDATIATVMVVGARLPALKGSGAPAAEPELLGICFVAGTPVQTPKGIKRIEDIKPGDAVYAVNFATMRLENKPVVRVFRNTSHQIIRVTISNAEGSKETFGVTPEHPFWIADKGWVLRVGYRMAMYCMASMIKFGKLKISLTRMNGWIRLTLKCKNITITLLGWMAF